MCQKDLQNAFLLDRLWLYEYEIPSLCLDTVSSMKSVGIVTQIGHVILRKMAISYVNNFG